MPSSSPAHTPRPQARRAARFSLGTIGAVFLVAFLAGCSHWPSGKTESGDQAAQVRLERCKLAKKQCQQRQETREQDCAADYKLVKSDYDQCSKKGTCQCRAPIACLGADLGICDRQFESCMSECGRRNSQDQTAESDPVTPEATTNPVIDQVPAAIKSGELTTGTRGAQSPTAPKTEPTPAAPKTRDAGTPQPGQAPSTTRPNPGKGPAG